MGYIRDCAENRKNELHREIVELDREINRQQNDYNSLIRFKGSVQAAQRNINIENTQKQREIKKLDAIKKKNTAAKKYQRGMDGQLNEVGRCAVEPSFQGLLRTIDRKLQELGSNIESMKKERFLKEWEYNAIDIMV